MGIVSPDAAWIMSLFVTIFGWVSVAVGSTGGSAGAGSNSSGSGGGSGGSGYGEDRDKGKEKDVGAVVGVIDPVPSVEVEH